MSKAECVRFRLKVDTSNTENNLINLALNEPVRSPTEAILRCQDGFFLSSRVSGKSGIDTYENDVSGLAESNEKIQKFVLNVDS